MTAKQTAIFGGITGIVASVAIMVLLGFGVSGVLIVRGTNLMYVLWPSSMMLVGVWRSTLPGITITASSVAINCVMYALIALLLRACIRSFSRASRISSAG